MYDEYYGRRSSRQSEDGYDVAQICLNGHVINSNAVRYPAHNQAHCSTCGEQTINQCQNCKSPIKGDYHVTGFVDFGSHYHPPAFCDNCGKPHPWTQRAQEAAAELIEFSSLNETEKADFKNSITDLMVVSPKTNVAKVKFAKYAKQAGIEVAKGLKDILVDVVSETVKKSIWG